MEKIESSCINLYESEFNNLYINRISYNKLDIVKAKIGSLNIKDSAFKEEFNLT